MELDIIKKKLSSYRGEGGRITKVSDELLLEILTAWEHWTGSAKEFYRGIGSNHKKMARMLGKAKQLRREGHAGDFQEIATQAATEIPTSTHSECGIELRDNGKVICFGRVDLLIEYLKKVA